MVASLACSAPHNILILCSVRNFLMLHTRSPVRVRCEISSECLPVQIFTNNLMAAQRDSLAVILTLREMQLKVI